MSDRMTQSLSARKPAPAGTDDGRHANRAWRYGGWFMLLLVLGVSLLLRLHEYSVWQEHRDLYCFEDEPVLLNVDG